MLQLTIYNRVISHYLSEFETKLFAEADHGMSQM